MENPELHFKKFLTEQSLDHEDSAHDLAHVERVVMNAKTLANEENADLEIVLPAVWLHDCVVLPKNHLDRSRASVLAADKAVAFLQTSGFKAENLDKVYHAIAAHSFSAGITPKTIEAKVVQDADRLDALGAIGIARCLMVGGALGRQLYNPEDPFCESRTPDDQSWNIDHFYSKLFKLPEMMQTQSGRKKAGERIKIMNDFLDALRNEIEPATNK